jgi:hypothetical protein
MLTRQLASASGPEQRAADPSAAAPRSGGALPADEDASWPAATAAAATAAPAPTAGVYPLRRRHTCLQHVYRLQTAPTQVAATPTPKWRASALSALIGAPVVVSTYHKVPIMNKHFRYPCLS